jgi:phospholipase C
MKSFACTLCVSLSLALAIPAFADVSVSTPLPGSTVTSPVQYIASATTTTCSQGVASMGIYVNNQLIYVVNGTQLNTQISLNVGPEHTVVEEWDYCGGATYTTIDLTVAAPGVSVSTPQPGSTVTSPVQYTATASTSTCSQGVASMGIYVNNQLVYVVNGAQLNTQISLNAGPEHTVVEEWDYCGGAAYTTIDLTVAPPPMLTVSISAKSPTITKGSSTVLSVIATNATSVTIAGSDGSTYQLPAGGGTANVSPTSTTTYTAEASNSQGNTSATSTVTVIPASSLNAIQHVVFMLQENHSFDSYFGMLNPYRHTNGWNIGANGQDYEVDGIDDKLNIISNQDDQGDTYNLFKLASTCVDDMTSAWLESYGDVNRWDFSTTRAINMDGFVHIAEGYANNCASTGFCSGQFTDLTGQRAMGYYDQDFLNYYYYMASQFALSDRWFSPVSSKSVSNRIATFTGGTTQGLVFDPGGDDGLPQLNVSTIFQELDAASVSWKVYYTVTQDLCLASNPCSTSASGNFPATTFTDFTYANQYLYENPTGAACTGTTQPSSTVGDPTDSFCIDTHHVAPLSQYFTDVANGTLPSFAFIESGSGVNDEHPGSGQSILDGQAAVAKIVNALMSSPSWPSSVFFFSYDEGGGPYDHVPPVPGYSNSNTDASLGTIPDISTIAVNPDSYNPCLPSGGTPTTHCDLRSSDPGTSSGDAAAQQGFAAQLGFRVPNFIVSPFTKKHYVSHTPMDHTAVIKFVENRFIGPSANLTARDADQSNLLEFFNFSSPPWSTPPSPPAPVSAASLGYDPCTPTKMQ